MVSSIQFSSEKPAKCYQRYYEWDSERVKLTHKKTNVVSITLLVSQYMITFGIAAVSQYELVVIYFEES